MANWSQVRGRRHFLSEETVYFTGSRGDETLLMLDIDCHKSGSLEGARQFAEFLKRRYFPNLYYETSTNGNGIHGYLVVDKRFWNEAQYNGVVKTAEKWLKKILASTDFDVETVELKGRCPSVVWGSDYKRQVAKFTMGGLAKMPRDATRLAEWKATTRLTAHDLRNLPELHPIADTPEVEVHVGKQEAAGSVPGKLIMDKELFAKYLPLAQRFVPASELVSQKSRVFVTVEDVAIFLVLLEYFSDNPNQDGSMPQKRFESLWRKLYEDSEVTRQFDNKRFAWIRNRVSDMGGIEWVDATFSTGYYKEDRRAAKWKVSGQLRELMERYAGVAVGSVTGVELQTSGEVLLSIDNKHQHMLSGSKAFELDALWLQMPVANIGNVGLRPKMVVVKVERWTLSDHLDELEAMGLAWMAA